MKIKNWKSVIQAPWKDYSLLKRLCLFIWIITISEGLSANHKINDQRISIQLNEVTLEKALESIEQQIGQTFFLNRNAINLDSIISINLKNEQLDNVIKSLFGANYVCEQIGDLIAVTHVKDEKSLANQFSSMQENKFTLHGTVTSEEGTTIPGVTIRIKGTNIGVSSDINGKFSISIEIGETLEISSIGYKSQSIIIKDQNPITISLKQDVKQLDEAVVTAMGIRKTNRNIGYAISTIKGEEIAASNTINPIAALQGKIAGLDINIVGASGVQGSPGIVIRGAKSLSKSAQPIFVVDGIILENNEAPTQGTDWGSQLKNLNPDDYKDITVLKGAAATALYGSRGANGAVVITSKTGEGMKGLGVELNYSYQWENIYANHIELQNVFGAGYVFNGREGDFGDDGNPMRYGGAFSFGPRMEGQMVKALYADDPVPYSPQKDNWKVYYQNGGYQNANVAISGGSERGNFRLSYSNTHNKGVLPNNKLIRNSVSLRGNTHLNKIFSLNFGISYSKTEVSNAASQGRWNDNSNIGRTLSYTMPRDFDLAYFRNNYRKDDGSLRMWGSLAPITHLLNRMDSRDDERTEESMLANLQLNAQITSWLDASVKVNYNLYKIFNETKERGSGVNYAGGYYGIGGEDHGSYNGLAMLHGSKKILDNPLAELI